MSDRSNISVLSIRTAFWSSRPASGPDGASVACLISRLRAGRAGVRRKRRKQRAAEQRGAAGGLGRRDSLRRPPVGTSILRIYSRTTMSAGQAVWWENCASCLGGRTLEGCVFEGFTAKGFTAPAAGRDDHAFMISAGWRRPRTAAGQSARLALVGGERMSRARCRKAVSPKRARRTSASLAK